MDGATTAHEPTTRRAGASVTLGLAALLATETMLLHLARDQWATVAGPAPATLDEVVVAVLGTVAVVLAAWLGSGVLASLAAHLPGRVGRCARAWADAWAPAVLRRVAAVVVGAALGGVLAPGSAAGTVPAPPPGFGSTAPRQVPVDVHAAPGPLEAARPPAGLSGPGFTTTAPAPGPATGSLAPAPGEPTGSLAPDPGWTPTRPVQRPQASARLVAGPSPRPAARTVVVLRGDTLWGIAARHLGPDASDAEIAREWPRWHAANRDVVGDDPDLLLPGQVLHAPARAEAVAR